MKSISARITIVFFAALFLCGSLLNYPFYRFALGEIKDEMHREVTGSSAASAGAVTLSFTADEFRKVSRGDDEMCVNGSWYDIICSATSNGKTVVSCLRDNDESMLQSWMKKVTDDNSNASNMPGKNGKFISFSISADYLPSAHSLFAFVVPGQSIRLHSSSFAVAGNGHRSIPEVPPRA